MSCSTKIGHLCRLIDDEQNTADLISEIELEIIENHQSLFDHILGDEIPDDIPIGDSDNHCDLEELNPPDAIEVADFDAEVDSSFTTWVLRVYFYVCADPDSKSTYLLFAIDWDDNWGQWRREPRGAVKGASSHE